MHQRLEQPCGVTPAGGERGFRWRGFLGLRLPDREQRGRHARRHIAWTDRPVARNKRARALGGSSGACANASAPGLSKPAQRASTFGAYFRVDDHYGICSVSLWDHWLPPRRCPAGRRETSHPSGWIRSYGRDRAPVGCRLDGPTGMVTCAAAPPAPASHPMTGGRSLGSPD